jgi:hypothetical protein
MQPSACEQIGDAHRAHGREGDGEPGHHRPDEVWKPVDGRRHLDQCLRALLVEAADPARDGGLRDEEPVCGRWTIPAACCLEREDRKPLGGRVIVLIPNVLPLNSANDRTRAGAEKARREAV